MGEVLLSELRDLVAEFPGLVRDARGRGLMCAISFRDPAMRDRALAVARERHRTLFLPSGPDSLRFRPPLSVRPEEIVDAVAALRKTLGEL